MVHKRVARRFDLGEKPSCIELCKVPSPHPRILKSSALNQYNTKTKIKKICSSQQMQSVYSPYLSVRVLLQRFNFGLPCLPLRSFLRSLLFYCHTAFPITTNARQGTRKGLFHYRIESLWPKQQLRRSQEILYMDGHDINVAVECETYHKLQAVSSRFSRIVVL